MVPFLFLRSIYTGIEAALRKRAGGSFSAVTEEFCKAQRNGLHRLLCKIQEEPRFLNEDVPCGTNEGMKTLTLMKTLFQS